MHFQGLESRNECEMRRRKHGIILIYTQENYLSTKELWRLPNKFCENELQCRTSAFLESRRKRNFNREVEKDLCFEGKLKVKRSDSTEIQHDVSKSTNTVQDELKSRLWRSKMVIRQSNTPIYHQFTTCQILQDEISVQITERGRKLGQLSIRDCQLHDCV